MAALKLPGVEQPQTGGGLGWGFGAGGDVGAALGRGWGGWCESRVPSASPKDQTGSSILAMAQRDSASFALFVAAVPEGGRTAN